MPVGNLNSLYVNSSQTLSYEYNSFFIDASASDLILTLPGALNGQYFRLRRIDTNSANRVSIITTGTDRIDSAVTTSGLVAIPLNVYCATELVAYALAVSGFFWLRQNTDKLFPTNAFGDGSLGTVTLSTDTTLTGDTYYGDLSINPGINLNTGGYQINVLGSLFFTNLSAIRCDGSDGQSGAPGSGGNGGPGGTLGGGFRGGGDGSPGSPTSGANTTIGGQGGTGGSGNVGGVLVGPPTNSGSAEVIRLLTTAARVQDKKANLLTGGTGGGGGRPVSQAGGGGGGGVILINARFIVCPPGTSASISAAGGKGGNAVGVNNDAAGGGGGGVIVILTKTPYLTAAQTPVGVTPNAPGLTLNVSGGGGGTATGTGSAGQAGGSGFSIVVDP